ncbi:18206_t:CDS:2 [Cetraspora pellucida]|uniref:18206_t:CDS:1 n=1 Tax=Cetraspora pellucida TaxID=1433469 RepID=A0ACA9M4N7_9GLOM|nr:18206_t:CDS:2 [Cetraspora pellucida]
MAQRHTGGPEKHRFTKDIIVLGVKTTNKYNTSCICKACDDAFGRDEALNETFTNKKNVVRNHLKKCKYFRAKLGSQEVVNDYYDNCTSDITSGVSSTTSKSTKKSRKRPSNSSSMSKFIVKDIATKDKLRFEQLLFRMTISNGWSILSNRILDAERINYIKSQEQKLKEDSIGVTLAFDGCKNILNHHIFGSLFILSTGEVQIWEAIDTSSERERMIEIIPKIENMIRDALSMKAKLLAIVSDSAPAYAAASSAYESDNEESNQHSNSLDELYLPQNITAILLNDNFWQLITRLHTLLLPYCGALNKLQSDTACLYDVLQAFSGILRTWEEYSDQDLAQRMILQLEQRWRQWEQPLLLLAFLLNPFIHAIWFNYNNENLNFTYLAQFVTYYYKAWFGCRPICILLELEDYRKHRFPFDFETYEQFEKDILRFWEFISSSTKELGLLVIRLFRICVNAASVERL